MSSVNGDGDGVQSPLEIGETLEIHANDGTALAFEVVALLEDPDRAASYAVLWNEGTEGADGQFIVTDMEGKLIEDDAVAQEILDDFLAFAEEEGGEGASGETR